MIYCSAQLPGPTVHSRLGSSSTGDLLTPLDHAFAVEAHRGQFVRALSTGAWTIARPGHNPYVPVPRYLKHRHERYFYQ